MRKNLLIVLLLGLLAAFVHGQNPDCALIVPENALTAQGLATPFQLTAADPAQGPCTMTNPDQQAFVQGIVLDRNSGAIYVYNPLVIDKGTQPAAKPVVPVLPKHNVVALWFGFNGGSLKLLPASANSKSLSDANCVDGLTIKKQDDIFGQFSYCNAPKFFSTAIKLVNKGKLVVPALGTARDGHACPTVRDFGIVDQDQSDNVITTYLLTPAGTIAQNTTANRHAFPGFEEISNGSDNFLLTVVDAAVGCTPWHAPDLADPGTSKAALALDELSGLFRQQQPIALVPAGDPMVLLASGDTSVSKLNLYRSGVGQPQVNSVNAASTTLYCQALGTIGPQRMTSWSKFLIAAPSLEPDASTNLFGFMVDRFINSWGNDGGLNCAGILNLPCPITATSNADGLTTGGTVTSHANLIPASAFQPGGEFAAGANAYANEAGDSSNYDYEEDPTATTPSAADDIATTTTTTTTTDNNNDNTNNDSNESTVLTASWGMGLVLATLLMAWVQA